LVRESPTEVGDSFFFLQTRVFALRNIYLSFCVGVLKIVKLTYERDHFLVFLQSNNVPAP